MLLARLFTHSFNLLVMDEPTNDLDIETLELLEQLLLDFSGTLLVVSHDRAFLDNVVTSTFVFEGKGHVAEFVGGYSDWLRQRKSSTIATTQVALPKQAAAPAAAPKSKKKQGLSHKEAKELAALPEKIDAGERERAALYASLADPVFLRGGAKVAEAKARLAVLEKGLEELTLRWEALEALSS